MLSEKFRSRESESLYTLTTEKDIKVGVKIAGQYSTDLDIREIHICIRNIFSQKIREIPLIQKKILLLDKSIEECDSSFLKKQRLIKEKVSHESDLRTFSRDGWEKYVEEVKPLLEEYFRLSPQKKTKKFYIGPSSQEDQSVETRAEEDHRIDLRLKVIRNFLRIAERYIDMDIICYPPYQEGCDNCGISIDQMDIDDDMYICKCKTIFGRVYTSETPNIDPDKIDSNVKNSYDDKTNFLRRLQSYQGIQSRKISKELLDTLDNHMQSKYMLPPSEEIRQMDPDEYGRRGIPLTSGALLIESLKETENTHHFQDIDPIRHELWGWKCPQIDHLIPKIVDDYIKTQEVYKKLYPNSSSINVELRLYWHLRGAGHKCLLEDFKMPQSRDSRKHNSSVFKTMSEAVGLEFFPIL